TKRFGIVQGGNKKSYGRYLGVAPPSPAAVRWASSPAAPRARRAQDSRQDAGATNQRPGSLLHWPSITSRLARRRNLRVDLFHGESIQPLFRRAFPRRLKPL